MDGSQSRIESEFGGSENPDSYFTTKWMAGKYLSTLNALRQCHDMKFLPVTALTLARVGTADGDASNNLKFATASINMPLDAPGRDGTLSSIQETICMQKRLI